MSKPYLRYKQTDVFGVIASANASSVVYSKQMIKGQYGGFAERTVAITSALENVLLWDLRTGELLHTLIGEKCEVTFLEKNSKNEDELAVGYSDGSIKIWSLRTIDVKVSLWGHKSAISCLKYDDQGLCLASGSLDTDVIVWDVVSETGLYRFKGHKGPITQLGFMKKANCLISSSKDTLIRVWDMDIQHCVQTLVNQKSEVRGFFLNAEESLLFTGTVDQAMSVYTVTYLSKEDRSLDTKDDLLLHHPDNDSRSLQSFHFEFAGNVDRHTNGKIRSIKYHTKSNILIIQTVEKSMELYKIRTHEEISKKVKSRIKKHVARAEKHEGVEISPEDISETPKPFEYIHHLHTLFISGRSFAFDVNPILIKKKHKDGALQYSLELLVGMKNNAVEFYSVLFSSKYTGFDSDLISSIDLQGHRSEVRATAISEDDKLLLTCASTHIKIWNITTKKSIRTIDSGYGVSCTFVQGSKFVLIGTKTGEIQLFDIIAGCLVENMKAHTAEVWSLSLDPNDKLKFYTGSADKTVKRWQFELMDVLNPANPINESDSPTTTTTIKQLGFINTAVLKVSDEVLSIKITPNSVYIAVALLDNTVKIFYLDSLKFYLTLYGHKLPVLAMDASTDSTKIITVSADKNIKIWGLDFGDCQKSIFAHDDNITQACFIPNTHYLLTASKDKTIKYWDCDTFIHVLTLKGHHGEIWAMAISRKGDYFVTGSGDKSLRIWTRTNEVVYVDEEKQNEMLDEFEETLLSGKAATSRTSSTNMTGANTDSTDVVSAAKTTLESIRSTESIIEALLLAESEEKRYAEYLSLLAKYCKDKGVPFDASISMKKEYADAPKFVMNVIIGYFEAKTPSEYVLNVLSKVKMSNIEDAIVTLSFSYCMTLCKYINEWIIENKAIELASKCLFLILKIHQSAISNNHLMINTLNSLRIYSRKRLNSLKDVIGYNLVGMHHLRDQLKTSDIHLFDDLTAAFTAKQTKKKRQKLASV